MHNISFKSTISGANDVSIDKDKSSNFKVHISKAAPYLPFWQSCQFLCPVHSHKTFANQIVLSSPALSCPLLSFPIISCHFLSFPDLSCPFLFFLSFPVLSSGLPKVIFLAIVKGKGGKTSAFKDKAEAEGLVFCIQVLGVQIQKGPCRNIVIQFVNLFEH